MYACCFADHVKTTTAPKACVSSPLNRMNSAFKSQGHFKHHRNSHFTVASKFNHQNHAQLLNKDAKYNPGKPSDSQSMNSVIKSQGLHRLGSASPPSSSTGGPQTQPLNMSTSKDNGSNKQQHPANNNEEQKPTKLTSFSVMDILNPTKFKPLGPMNNNHKLLPAIPSLRPIHPPPFMASQMPASTAEFLAHRQNLALHSHVKSLQNHQCEATASKPPGEYSFHNSAQQKF